MKKMMKLFVAAVAGMLLAGTLHAQKSMNLDPIDALEVNGKFNVQLVPSFGDRITIAGADDNTMKNIISVEVKGSKLVIKNRSKQALNFPAFTIQLEYRGLSKIELESVASLTSAQPIKAKNLEIEIEDEASMLADLEIENSISIELKDKAQIGGSLTAKKGTIKVGETATNNLNVAPTGKIQYK